MDRLRQGRTGPDKNGQVQARPDRFRQERTVSDKFGKMIKMQGELENEGKKVENELF